MRHLPNILSGIRLILVGVFVVLFRAGRYLPALSVFVFAFFTDVLDGQLARANGWVTNLGKLLDPLADKLMTLAALVCIYWGKQKTLYLVLFLLMALKELLMVIGGLFMAKRSVVAMADWPGKIATGLFAVGVMLSLLSFLSLPVEPWNLVILAVATAMSYFALVFYAATQLPKALGKRNDAAGGA
ncbi:MAG: CDP-diacylglycerol--glycerol-3-phosphate 3-phosphatidyltransferase [Clostridiales bacterium]|nr:CDP-diacylglycerol--glycerol-3-phosphate 3-phosphatidyltransferase [Clostridiales bacterium]